MKRIVVESIKFDQWVEGVFGANQQEKAIELAKRVWNHLTREERKKTVVNVCIGEYDQRGIEAEDSTGHDIIWSTEEQPKDDWSLELL